jgi:hypothetical protein
MSPVKSLTAAQRADLDDYVQAEFDSEVASQQANSRRGRQADRGSYTRRLVRLAETKGYNNLQDLLVWYESEGKGAANADTWRERLTPVFEQVAKRSHPHALSILDRLWRQTQEEGKLHMQVLLPSLGSASQVHRRLTDFSREAGIPYSAAWLVFLYALHKKLEAMPTAEQPT